MTRIRLIRPDEGTPEQKAYLERAPQLNLFAALAHNPALARRFAGLGAAVMSDCALAPRLREIAALRVAWRCGAPYVLAQHERVARLIGMSDDEIGATRAEGVNGALNPLERRVLALADACLKAPPSTADVAFSDLKAELGEIGMVELLTTIGYFAMTSIFTSALMLDVE